MVKPNYYRSRLREPVLERVFGAVLREIRLGKAMSQEVLAFEAELTRNYISQLELGEKSPSLRSLYKLCSVLNVPPSSLLLRVEAKLLAFYLKISANYGFQAAKPA